MKATELAWWLEAAFASEAELAPWRNKDPPKVANKAMVARAHRSFFIDTPFLFSLQVKMVVLSLSLQSQERRLQSKGPISI